MSFIIRLTLLLLLLANSVSAIAAKCWPELNAANPKKEKFILAMGANTGDLKMANHDAESFAEAIQERFGVPDSHVCRIEDVQRWEFEEALDKLKKLVREEDKVFLFFSGHGSKKQDLNNDEGPQKNCYDEAFVILMDGGQRTDTVTDDNFVDWVENIQTDQIITVIDTCFASGMLRGEKLCQKAKSKFIRRNENEYLESKDCKPSSLKKLKGVLYAASKEHQNAWEIRDGGIFTTTFVKNISPKKSLLESLLSPSKSENTQKQDSFDFAQVVNFLDKAFKNTDQHISTKTREDGCNNPQDPERWPKQ